MHLNKHHISLLKQISKDKVIRTDKYQLDDVEYLRSEGLVVAMCVDKKDDFYYQPKITEKGKAVLYEWTHTSRKANIALIVSIFALLISFLVAFTPFADWSKKFISTVMHKLFG